MDAITTIHTDTERPRRWRDVLPVHPAAELFPLMSAAELQELADDIKKNGLSVPVSLYRDPEVGLCVLDGRNRADALELIGKGIGDDDEDRTDCVGVGDPNFDPYSYVVSQNLHRRHLTAEQKRDIVANLLALNPARSNRAIAAIVHADDKTVAKVRTELESTADIPQLEMTTGKDGKARPAKRARTAPPAPGDVEQLPTPVEMAPMVSSPTDYDINRLRSAMREVEAQAAASNVTRLREAIEALAREAANALRASRITLAPDRGLQ